MTWSTKIVALREPTDNKSFVTVRERMKYIGVRSRIEVLENFQLFTLRSNAINTAEQKKLSKTLQNMKKVRSMPYYSDCCVCQPLTWW